MCVCVFSFILFFFFTFVYLRVFRLALIVVAAVFAGFLFVFPNSFSINYIFLFDLRSNTNLF